MARATLVHAANSGALISFGAGEYPVAMSFFAALNALGISMLGEYVVRIYDQVRGRPLYLIRIVLSNSGGAGLTTIELLDECVAKSGAAADINDRMEKLFYEGYRENQQLRENRFPRRQIALTDVNTGSPGESRDIDTIVDDDPAAVRPRHRHSRVAQIEQRSRLELLGPDLDERGAAVKAGAQEVEGRPPAACRDAGIDDGVQRGQHAINRAVN